MCSSAVWLHDAYNVTVKGISLAVQTLNISGIIVKNVSSVDVQLSTACSLTDKTENVSIGIAVFELPLLGYIHPMQRTVPLDFGFKIPPLLTLPM